MTVSLCLPPNACLAIISIVKDILNVRAAPHKLDSRYLTVGVPHSATRERSSCWTVST